MPMKAILDRMLKKPGFERNLYWEYRMVTTEKVVKSDARKTKTKTRKKVYGITTTGSGDGGGTRNIMINDILHSIVMNNPELIKSKYIFSDITGLQRKKTGKIEHGPTTKDDSLFSFLLAHYVLRYGTNLKKYVVNLDKIKDSTVHKARKKFLNIFATKQMIEDAENGNVSAQFLIKDQLREEQSNLQNAIRDKRISKKILNLLRN